MVDHSKVSWASTVSRTAPYNTQYKSGLPSAVEAELTHIKQMLELVIRENQQLKAENAQLKAKNLPPPAARPNGPIAEPVTPIPVSVNAAVEVMCESEADAPPLKRKAGTEPGDPTTQKFIEELETKIDARLEKLQDMFSKFAESVNKQLANLNTRVLAIENAQTIAQQTPGVGAYKSKPYSRPNMGEGARTFDNTSGHYGPE